MFKVAQLGAQIIKRGAVSVSTPQLAAQVLSIKLVDTPQSPIDGDTQTVQVAAQVLISNSAVVKYPQLGAQVLVSQSSKTHLIQLASQILVRNSNASVTFPQLATQVLITKLLESPSTLSDGDVQSIQLATQVMKGSGAVVRSPMVAAQIMTQAPTILITFYDGGVQYVMVLVNGEWVPSIKRILVNGEWVTQRGSFRELYGISRMAGVANINPTNFITRYVNVSMTGNAELSAYVPVVFNIYIQDVEPTTPNSDSWWLKTDVGYETEGGVSSMILSTDPPSNPADRMLWVEKSVPPIAPLEGLLNEQGAESYWDLEEDPAASNEFSATIGSSPIIVGSNLLYTPNDDPLSNNYGSMTISGGFHIASRKSLGTTDWTFGIWVWGGGSTGYRSIAGGGGTYRYWYLYGLRMYPYGFSWNGTQGAQLSESRWYNVILTCDSNDGVKYYLDGTLQYSHATPVAFTTDSSNVRFGTNNGGGEVYGAPMSHPFTFNRPITQTEIDEIMAL